MSSRAGSTVLTFLMSIPIAAVGLMAVFGVPPLSSVIAASRGQQHLDADLGFDEDRSSRSGKSDRDGSDEEAPSWSDADSETELGAVAEFDSDAETDRDDLGFSRPSSKSPHKRTSSTREADEDPLKFDDERSSDRSTAKSRGLRRDATNPFPEDEAPSSGRTSRVSMKDSLKKLNTLNVKKYHLVPVLSRTHGCSSACSLPAMIRK